MKASRQSQLIEFTCVCVLSDITFLRRLLSSFFQWCKSRREDASAVRKKGHHAHQECYRRAPRQIQKQGERSGGRSRGETCKRRVFTTKSRFGVLQKLREKRITECVELRKAHKNESFLKRRNITLSSRPDEDALSPDYTSNEMVGSHPSEPVWLAPVEP